MNYRRFVQAARYLLLAGLFLLISASAVKAEDMKGNFSLPFEAQWAGVVLPAGDYTFTIDSTGEKPIQLRAPDGRTVYRLIANTETVDTPAKSQLVVIQSSISGPTIHILYLANIKTAFHFRIPQRYEVTSRIIASSSGQANIEHIPVITAGN